MAHITSARMARRDGFPFVGLPRSRFPPLCLLPGHTPAQVWLRENGSSPRHAQPQERRQPFRATHDALKEGPGFLKRGQCLLNLLLDKRP